MIDMKFLKPNVIYRAATKYRLPVNVKKPSHGSVYIPVTKNMGSTARFFTRPLFIPRLLNRYYHDRVFNYRIYNQLVKFRIKDQDLRDLVEEKVTPITPFLELAITPGMLNGRNYVHDISSLNEKFFGINDSRIGMRRVDEYFRLFKEFTADAIDSTKYDNKVLFIPIDDWVDNLKQMSIYRIRDVSNFFSLFYHKLKNDHEYFVNNFQGWKFYFVYNKQLLYVQPEEFTEESAEELRKLFIKFKPIKPVAGTTASNQEDEEDTVLDENEAKNLTDLANRLEERLNSSEFEIDDDILTSLINKTVEKHSIDLSSEKVSIKDDQLVSKKEIELEKIQTSTDELIPKSKARLAREKKLVEEMKNLKLGDMELGEIQARADANRVGKVDIPIDTLNPNLKEMTFPNFDQAYLDNLYKADIVKAVTGFQYKDRPLYLIESSVKDVSDELNELEEYTFKFEDEAGRRHNFTVELPKFINGRFMKISGNKKIMTNQILPLPITKTGPDTVQVATNYKKTFIKRFGRSLSPKTTVFFRQIAKMTSKDVTVGLGSAKKSNRGFITTIEYDELSDKYRRITTPKMTIFFDQTEIREEMKNMKKEIPSETDNRLPIGINDKKEVIFLNTDKNTVGDDEVPFMDFMTDVLSEYEPDFKTQLSSIKSGRRYMYSRAEIMKKSVPLILLLSYLSGLITIMKKAKIDYRIISKEDSKRTPNFKKGEEEVIEFQDAWLVYPIYPIKNSLLLNGFVEVPTKLYTIDQFLTKDVYHEIFDTLYGRSNIGYAFENFQQLMIDPITEDILEDHGLPTNFIDVMIYANSLLEDNNYLDAGDMREHRVRSNEMIVAFLYESLSKAYEQYRRTADNPNPVRMSTRKNDVIVRMLTSQVTNDYSDINPLYTIDIMRGTTYKGPAGMNQDRAYNLSKRAYHPTMLGVLSQASPISGSIGIARTLTVDSNVVSARGYIKTSETPEEIKSLPSTKILSGSEASIPFGATSDDPERTAMLSAQSKHTIACIGSERTPVTTGFDKALPHLIGDTFVHKAKKDGKIIKIDEDMDVMLIKYDDDSVEAVNLNPEMGKNSGGGFFISNELVPTVKVGQSVKADHIVAHNPEFFTKDKRSGDSVFMTGPLARVAIRYSSKVFEDSTIISERLSRKMSSHIVVKKDIALGKNSNIDFMVKKGDSIKVNDPLIIFDTSHDDELTNKILSQIGEETTKDIIEASKTPVVSKHNGTIADIKIYYTVPKEELSESARKIIEYYERDNRKRVSSVTTDTNIDKKDLNLSLVEATRVEPDMSGKVKGVKVGEGILIEFYIKYLDKMGVGDKLTSFIATKSIVCDIFDEGKEPYLLSDPEDKIDTYVGVISIGARMTHSFIKISQVNGIIVGMKKNIKKMYEEIYGEKIK